MRTASLVIAAAAVGARGGAAAGPGAEPPVATFSIVAFDPANGDLGVAVASKFFAVGSVVPWAEAGVGAVATQAHGNTTFGPKGLAAMRGGATAKATLDGLLAADEGRERRQVGIVDAKGTVAHHTGRECTAWAGAASGAHWTAQGNLLVSGETVRAMGRAFEATKGELAERLLAALEAGEAAGGDSRGRQSAALLVVREGGGYAGLNDRYVDLRVDDAKEPVRELRRLLGVALGHARVTRAYALSERGEHGPAVAEVDRAIAAQPADRELLYHRACVLCRAGRRDEALAALETALAAVPALATPAAVDADLAPLRDDPRFRALLAKHAAKPPAK
jgi:uncharacterized Ntn-hydrolase superfamily protein